MKKLFKLALMLITVCLLTIGAPEIARAEGAQQAYKTVAVTDGNNRGAATLYGSGDNYITDLKVRIEFKNHAPYEIALEDGYSPFIAALDFGAEDKLLFCSSQTGGSGGYGNYRIYRVKTDSYQLLYDDKTDSKAYTYRARFLIGGFMDIYDCTTENDLIVHVGYMDGSFYDRIFNADGSLTGEQPYVNAVSFVSPALNPASGVYRLITYRSVAAVAEVNRLGYIVNTLDFDGKAFTPSFTEFSIKL